MSIESLITFSKTVLPILLVIFLVVLISIVLIRIIVRIFLLFAKRNYQNIVKKIQAKQPIKAQKVLPKADSEKFIKKEKPRDLVEVLQSQAKEQENEDLDEVQIVDIVKPIGFWTSMILGQKLTYLVSSAKIMNKSRKKGFWTSMVEAQERAQGREKGRSL